MIRTPTENGWLLVTHPDHARLAGELADAWGNDQFAPPEPYAHVRHAVYHHDDGWLARDAVPFLTKDGKPSAFSRELVGAYAAFEEIDLADYLAVRGQALDACAAVNPYAAVVVSLHTVNLLTKQAAIETIRVADRPLHAAFVAGQEERQRQLADGLRATPLAAFTNDARFDHAFRFLQCCDSFSLIACSSYDRPRPLRHAQVTRAGAEVEILCTPLGADTYRLTPWPLRETRCELRLPFREVPASACATIEAFHRAFAEAAVQTRTVTLVA